MRPDFRVLNTAMIGCGNFMACQHLPNVKRGPRYRIHALCDLDAKVEAFAEAVAAGAPFAPGVVEGARATVCALKAFESMQKNRPVPVRPEDYGLNGVRARPDAAAPGEPCGKA